eukprot:TRINITY_DN5157_c0_g1_i2.p1 TRINITY_DN5157_c0_g1~~TRINITY_DN5157_c0_g1_i2.p1  ORF type:complete len:212 (+),score=33.87 TRINITY_DN5157_c0_g1_i2:189-824(+)
MGEGPRFRLLVQPMLRTSCWARMLWSRPCIRGRQVQASSPLCSAQDRRAATVPNKVTMKGHAPDALLKKVSRSGGPGGQSVNMSDTRVQLSFRLEDAAWLPDAIKGKMRVIHKNRISKSGEFSVAVQTTSSQIQNEKLAVALIQKLVKEAEQELKNDEFEANKLGFVDYVIMKKKKEGREEELLKREQALKDRKSRSREKTRNKKELKHMW